MFLPHRSSRAAGVRGRRFDPAFSHVTEHSGLRLTTPSTTWVHLASELTVDELIMVGDAIVRVPRRRGMIHGTDADALATIAELELALDTGRRQGAAKLRAALPQVRVGSASPPETRLRLACQRAGLPDPELDYDVFTLSGAPIGYTELAFPDYRTLVEYEGDHHRVDRAQWTRDIEKHAACFSAGWAVVRLTSAHVYPSTAPAIELIRRDLVRGGWRP
ncbi:hypothetical protein ACH3VR_11840 [Microbacterium sp. B2969]|uniref:DUF559 domain-containing protein n=1 Tax=Microbacterium alkaliflavum TaxID=3248839 RepID=A0ABW7Q863_9MICO